VSELRIKCTEYTEMYADTKPAGRDLYIDAPTRVLEAGSER
jgi:hypothetical protein